MTTTERLAIAPILELSVRQALEIMCFTEAQTVTDAEPHSSDLTARVSFSGDRSGSLELAAEPPTAAALTATFLGLGDTDEPAEKLRSDTLRELAGVVCGRLISSVDPAGRFEMQAWAGPAGKGDLKDAIQRTFRVASGDLRAVLHFS
jgi:hypothetical protein